MVGNLKEISKRRQLIQSNQKTTTDSIESKDDKRFNRIKRRQQIQSNQKTTTDSIESKDDNRFNRIKRRQQIQSNQKTTTDSIESKDDNRFNRIKRFLFLKTTEAILNFSLTILNVEPFLSLFQAERPLSVFLYEKLKCIVTLLLERVCRPEVLKQTVRKLLCLDLGKDSNLLPESSVKIGFGAEKALKKLQSTLQADVIRNFRKSAKRMMIGMIQQIFERSPLKYPLTLRISCLSPTQINAVPNEKLENRCNKLLELLVESDWITPPSADRAQNQYRLFINDDEVLKKIENVDVVQDRMDEVYLSLMEHTKYPDLEQMVKIVLILSHGYARVESEFFN